MARLIPPIFPQDCAPGEQSVYRALAASSHTDDWTVLHSLNIAKHVRHPQGEADFVVIAPKLGILVIEVKSHQQIDFQEGVWHLGNQAPTTKSPFQQANDAKFSIRNELKRKNINLYSLPTLHAVWFTGVRARTTLKSSAEWHSREVLDSDDLKVDPIGAIRRAFKQGTAHLDETFRGFSDGGVGPDKATAEKILKALRPNFEIGPVPGDMRSARMNNLVHFVEEQYVALDAMADNVSVLFTGPAGSGKTFLAMEAARRELERDNHGRLMCFNNLLGKRLATEIPDDDRITVGTFHSQLLSLTGMRTPDDNKAAFWSRQLPEKALEVLLETDSKPADFLIIDEVQDLLVEPYLDVLDLMVKGGLESGRILLFGDFERQAIFDAGEGHDLLKTRMPQLPSHRLTINCRNLPRIGHTVNLYSGLTPGYERFRRDDDGSNPVLIKYEQGADQSEKLREAVVALREEHFGLDEIVVLSPRVDSSAASTTDPWLKSILDPIDGRSPREGRLRYSTIHAFKGLEAPAIIVTDLDRELVPNFESITYIGLTRATDRLYGLIEETTGLASLKGAT